MAVTSFTSPPPMARSSKRPRPSPKASPAVASADQKPPKTMWYPRPASNPLVVSQRGMILHRASPIATVIANASTKAFHILFSLQKQSEERLTEAVALCENYAPLRTLVAEAKALTI